MTEGTSQGLFVVVAIVIFGIFVGLTYTLFGSEGGLSNDLENIFNDAFSKKPAFDKNADYNVGDVIPNDESDFIFDGVNTIIGYIGTDTEVIIPNTIDDKTVTTISGDAFNNKGITKLIMPNSLTTIEDGSLVTNTAFNSVDLENEEDNTIKDNLNNLLFMEVSASETKSSKQVIGAFANNTIEEISFSANIEYIGSFAFFSGTLEDVVFPEGLETIKEGSFEENLIKEIKIPATVTNLGDNAFKNNLLKEVTYGKGSNLENIGTDVFSGNKITNLELPKGTTSIPSNAYNNAGLESITIPQGVTSIGNNAFSNNNLTEVSIPKGVTSISDNSFSNNKLTNVFIPNGVTKIGKEAFKENLLEEVVIPESVVELDNGSFRDNDLTNVDLPSGLQRIGDYAFYKNKLPIVNLPESLLLIGVHAFEYNELLDVTIPSKLTTIKEWTFAHNKMPKKPTIPTNISTEESYAFYGNLFDEKVMFKDVNLGKAIAEALGVSVDNITQRNMGTLTELNLSGKAITNLDGLEHAINLKKVDASNNTITDIRTLTSIKTLTELNVSNNKIVTISSIGNIKVLNIKTNPLDLSSSIYLENLTGLTLTLDKQEVFKEGTTTGTIATTWTVPISDYYLIEVSGAKGGTGGGGSYYDGRYSESTTSVTGQRGTFGDKIISKVFLDKGEVINIYQGNLGVTGTGITLYSNSPKSTGGGSGGGESKVVSTTRKLTLVSAKGGNGGNGGKGGNGGTGIGSNNSITGMPTITKSTKDTGYASIQRVLN